MPDSERRSGPSLGFIGLGAMGGRMARRLLTAGYDLTLYDRARERARPLEQSGAKFAPTPKRLAAAVDVVLSSLTDDAALEEVMFGPEGALKPPSSSASWPSSFAWLGEGEGLVSQCR